LPKANITHEVYITTKGSITFPKGTHRSTKKKTERFCVPFFLSTGYKKDILGSFVYEFELLQKMKSLLTQG